MPNETEYNFTNTQLNLIHSGSDSYTFDSGSGDNINVVVYDVHNVVKGSFNSKTNDFQIYNDASEDVYIKPNEILQGNEFPEGNYKIQINHFRDFWDSLIGTGYADPVLFDEDTHFIVTEVSPSRKEIRVRAKYILNTTELVVDSSKDPILEDYLFTNTFQEQFSNILGNFDTNEYKFDYLLSIDDETQIPIINYTFDSVSNPNFVSLIIRLSKPITFLNNYDRVSIKKELIDTQTLDFYYFSDIPPVTDIPISLDVNTSDYDIIGEPESDIFQNYDQVSSTGSLLSDLSVENFLISGSDYKNLNIDYNTFSNHTFFGSAKEKLYNFKQKVGTIEGYYNQISQSLQHSASQVTVTGGTGKSYEDSTRSPRHIINKRSELFDKIQEEINSFTPYERFLYFDGQSQTTASAPTLGPNYATAPALFNSKPSDGAGGYRPDSLEILTDWDGLGTIYKFRQTGSNHPNGKVYIDASYRGNPMDSTPGLYTANNKPFYGYSGSVWFSFLAKMDGQVSSDDGRRLSYPTNRNYKDNWVPGQSIIPANAYHQSVTQWPLLSSGSWQRHICRVSQSYWRPHSGVDYNTSNMVTDDFKSSGEGTSYIILSSSEQIYSASTDNYPPIKLHGDYIPLGTTITGSLTSFSGSVIPSHILFNVHMVSASGPGEGTEPTSSYISDFKVTLNDPTEAHPFSTMYQTGSTVWDSWYNGMYDSASAWDDNNIHSLQNNLPKTLRIRDDSDELKKFLNMWGEQFDLIRNYIDNYSSFHKRGYKLNNSVPTNLMPVIADSLGWELIAPFTGSLTQFFGGSESEIHGDITTTETVTHNTWRKIINNLVYLYKSKGTLNSIDSMLNIYGYPSDVITLKEDGGSTEEHNPSFITNNAKNLLKAGLGGQSGSVSYNTSPDTLYSYVFNKDSRRVLNFDWWMNDAKNIDTIEFIIKPQKSSFTQDLIINSGSTSESLWDLRLKSVTNSSSHGQLEFRLSDEQHSTSSLTNQAVSMSTDTLPFKDGRYWNVMLQRMTSSISGTGIQEYRLSTGAKKYYDYQGSRTDGDFITNFSVISMSVSGGTTANAGYYANQNWESTGSLTSTGTGNLYVGKNYTGSLAEFRAWTIPLSSSKFKQHILNYRSVIGHHISSSQYDLIYHYPMNENWSISSSDGPRTNPKIYDNNPRNVKDYSIFIPSASFLSSSGVYNQDIVSNVQLSTRTVANNQGTDNKVLINPPRKMTGNLDPNRRNERDIYSDLSLGRNKKPQRIATTLVEIGSSPQDKINSFILNNLADVDITQYFADPQDLYEDKYIDLVKLRDDLYRHYDISIDVNKWIRAQEKLFPKSLIEGLKKMVPAKSTIKSTGVVLKPTILDRDKVEHKRSSLETDTPKNLDISITTSSLDLSDSQVLSTYDAEHSVDITTSDSSYEVIKKAQVSRSLQASSTYESTKDDNIDMMDSTYQVLSSNPTSYDKTFEITKDSYTLESSHNPNMYDKSISIVSQSYVLESSKQDVYDKTFEITKDSYNISSLLWIPYSGSVITNISDMGQKSYYNPNDDWGRTKNDLHFVNFAGNKGSDGYYNNAHYETRHHFYMIGDVEEISSSFSAGAIGLSSFGNTYQIYRPYYVNPTQIKNFKNRQIVDKGKGFTYTSYISGSDAVSVKGVSLGRQDGRAMGKTGFFATSSVGRIYYPSNHYINFQDGFVNNLWAGTQFQGGYYFQCPVEDGWTDLSKDAFYTVNVTGDNELRVNYGKDTIESVTTKTKIDGPQRH